MLVVVHFSSMRLSLTGKHREVIMRDVMDQLTHVVGVYPSKMGAGLSAFFGWFYAPKGKGGLSALKDGDTTPTGA